MTDTLSTNDTDIAAQQCGKDSPGRGTVIIIYGLYLGAIMGIVTLPLGALIAHYRLGRGAPWLDSHLRFQICTFWLLVPGAVLAMALWGLLGRLGAPPISAWAFGYLSVTAAMVWYIARCGVGIYRITSNQPIARPYSLLVG